MGQISVDSLKGYDYVTKPLRYISITISFVLMLGMISSFSSYFSGNNEGNALRGLLIINCFFLGGIIYLNYTVETIMRYYLFSDSMHVPQQWIKPRKSNQLLKFSSITKILQRHGTYSFFGNSGVEYKINPAFNDELIPRLKNNDSVRWDELFVDS